MATISKTHTEIKQTFRQIAHLILKLPETDNKTIRFPWGSNVKAGSAPGFTRNQNVVFIYALPADGSMGQCKDISFVDDGSGSGKLTYVDEHTDILGVRFVCYGPDSFEWARAIRDGISRPDVKALMDRNKLALVLPVPAPVVVPELVNGEWWNRADLSITFNMYVRIEIEDSVNAIEEVTVKTTSGKKAEKTKASVKEDSNANTATE